jgi:hypothetical protein
VSGLLVLRLGLRGLVSLGGAEIRRWPYTVRVGDRYKVRRYGGEVLITLVLALAIKPLAIIYAVIYIYSKYLKVRYLIS